jgi:hypothetical protein
MAISNCLFSPTSENPRGFSVWCVLAKLSAKPTQLLIAETVSTKHNRLYDTEVKLENDNLK